MKHFNEPKGIHISPTTAKPHHNIVVAYDGLLVQSGADEVYVHCGSSDRTTNWNNIQDVPMRKHSDGTFSADVYVPDGERLNICFHDNADNWDNNNWHNYSVPIR